MVGFHKLVVCCCIISFGVFSSVHDLGETILTAGRLAASNDLKTGTYLKAIDWVHTHRSSQEGMPAHDSMPEEESPEMDESNSNEPFLFDFESFLCLSGRLGKLKKVIFQVVWQQTTTPPPESILF